MAEVAVQVSRVAGLIVLAHTLAPSDFGLFRVVMIVGSVALMTTQVGIPDALVQRQELSPSHEATSFWCGLVSASGAAVALYLGAGPIARFMLMPKLVQCLRLLCIPIVIEGASATAGARLRRRLEFGALATADVVAELTFILVALGSLVLDLQRWTLTLGFAARMMIHGFWVSFADGYWPRDRPRLAALRDLRKFGFNVWMGTMLNTLSYNADFVLIGRFMGPHVLGYYSMAWELLRFVPDRLHRVVGRVTLPVFCRLQHSNPELAQLYGDVLEQIAAIWLPVVSCVIVFAPELLETAYGAQWLPAASALRLLAPGIGVVGMGLGMGSVFYAKGRPQLDIYLHALRLVLICATVIALRNSGLWQVSFGVGLVEAVVILLGVKIACDLIDLRLATLAARVIGGLAMASGCGVLALVGRTIAIRAGLDGLPLLAVGVVVPAILLAWRQADKLRELMTGAMLEAGTRSVSDPPSL
jgi:O-antigen/teichoic acid export membrane protein